MSQFLTIPAREFIHLPSVGDKAACKQSFDTIDGLLKMYYEKTMIRGYHIITIKNTEDIDNHFIETDYSSITNGKFPFLYLFIQPMQEYGELDDIITQLNLVKL